MKRLAVLSLALLLAACGGGDSQEDKAGAAAKAAAGPGGFVLGDGGATPNEDRVATIGLLNKRNNISQDLVMKTGESRRVGNVIVKLASCERTLPWERPEEVGAFVQLLVDERAASSNNPDWRKVFSGWLFKNSPALNVVEHEVYDVWVKDCAMSFPGEEASPASAASDSSAAKPSGSESTATPAPAAPEPAEDE
jgi:hypothetical protein